MNKYSTIVQVLISLKFRDNIDVDIDEIKNNTGLLIAKLFPLKNNVSTAFKTQMYSETHQITWDLSGSFNESHDQVMESNSEREALENHFGSVLSKYFGMVDAEYKVYACGYAEPILECAWGK